MKPRNIFEKAVLAQSEKLRPITKVQEKWAFRNCIDHYAYRLPKGRTTCMDCGHTWVIEQERKLCSCPNCKAELKVRNTRGRKVQQRQYFTILTTSGEYQVLRMFLLIATMEKGCKAKYYSLEIGHYWWNAQGRKAIVTIQKTLGRYVDTFLFSSSFAIRRDNDAYKYVASAPIYPKFKATDILKRNGFKGDFHDIAPTRLISALLTDPRAETLLKAGQYPMLEHYLYRSFDMERYWASVKICIRNGYTIKDGSMWCDMIDLQRHFGKDTNNRKYVCPSDLRTEHDSLLRKRNRQRELEQLAERRREAEKHEKEYRKLKGKFFGIVITDGTLNIRVLESVAEFAEEGTMMHHCVWANAYYLKKDSLVLSATIDGKRIETVEVSLKTFKVVQSRGLCNKNTEYHDRIISLVDNNMNLIRKRTRTKKTA